MKINQIKKIVNIIVTVAIFAPHPALLADPKSQATTNNESGTNTSPAHKADSPIINFKTYRLSAEASAQFSEPVTIEVYNVHARGQLQIDETKKWLARKVNLARMEQAEFSLLSVVAPSNQHVTPFVYNRMGLRPQEFTHVTLHPPDLSALVAESKSDLEKSAAEVGNPDHFLVNSDSATLKQHGSWIYKPFASLPNPFDRSNDIQISAETLSLTLVRMVFVGSLGYWFGFVYDAESTKNIFEQFISPDRTTAYISAAAWSSAFGIAVTGSIQTLLNIYNSWFERIGLTAKILSYPLIKKLKKEGLSTTEIDRRVIEYQNGSSFKRAHGFIKFVATEQIIFHSLYTIFALHGIDMFSAATQSAQDIITQLDLTYSLAPPLAETIEAFLRIGLLELSILTTSISGYLSQGQWDTANAASVTNRITDLKAKLSSGAINQHQYEILKEKTNSLSKKIALGVSVFANMAMVFTIQQNSPSTLMLGWMMTAGLFTSGLIFYKMNDGDHSSPNPIKTWANKLLRQQNVPRSIHSQTDEYSGSNQPSNSCLRLLKK